MRIVIKVIPMIMVLFIIGGCAHSNLGQEKEEALIDLKKNANLHMISIDKFGNFVPYILSVDEAGNEVSYPIAIDGFGDFIPFNSKDDLNEKAGLLLQSRLLRKKSRVEPKSLNKNVCNGQPFHTHIQAIKDKINNDASIKK